MDLCFGISLDPLAVPQRHTLYDSESDGESETHDESKGVDPGSVFSVNAENDGTKLLKGKTLLLAVGSTASVFLRSFVRLRQEATFSLRADVDQVERGKPFPSGKGVRDISCVFAAEGRDEWAVCTHVTELRVEYCNFWAEKVFEQGDPNQVIIFLCRPLHEYFNPSQRDEDHTHLMRGLQSSSWPHPQIASPLQPPNAVQGEAAAVLTYCELHSIPASMCLLYWSSSQTEQERVMSFVPTLQHPLMAQGLPTRVEEEGKLLIKNLLPKPRTDLSTLYT